MLDDERHEQRHGWIVPATLALAMAATALGAALYLFAAGQPEPLSPASVPKVVTQAAKQLGSTVATSAKELAGQATQQVKERSTRPHIVPTAGKAVTAPTHRFVFDGVRYSITPHVASDVYWGAKKSTRLMVQLPGESNEDWTVAYYHAFAYDAAQNQAIDDVARQLQAIRAKAKLTPDQYLELIAKYVQSIPYDWAVYQSGTGKQRFPVEVLVDDKGLCGDKSVLLADLLSHEGYAVSLLDFGPEKHMAVGVKGPGHTYGGSGCLFLETTGPVYITDVPPEYSGGMKLHSEPIVVPIGSGTTEYMAADQIAKIISVRDSAAKAADRLYNKARRENLSDSQVAEVNRKLKIAYRAQTSLRSNVVDRNGNAVGSFMDRTVALRWIDVNVWWM
jgi:hypothetical protein